MFSTEREGVTLPAMPFASDPPSAADIAALAARVQSHFLRDARPREVFADLLPQMLAATRSGYGFIAELRQAEDGATTLKVFALTGSDRDDAAGASVPGDTDGAAVVRNLHTMFGAAALESGQPVIANDPTDELRAGLPAGRGALEAFLGVPLLHFGALVGMVGLANRPGGYDAALVATFEPLWSAVGSILGSVKLDRDRRRADQALRERDALLARLTEHVPAVIFQYRRRDGGHECMPYATEGLRQLYGLAPEHVRDNAQALHDRIHPEDLPRVRASIAESARVLSPWRLEFRAQTHDGTRWHEGHAMPERESDGGTLWYGYIVDITERKRYQEALVSVEAAQRANAAKTEFLSRMSHELRTPLNAVLGFAQLMQIDETQSMSDVQRARIGHIERAGTHLLAMINDVLDLSRIEAGTMPLSPEPLSAASVLDDALTLVASQAHNAGVKLAPPTASRELWLHADRVRLRQVLANLLSNAIKYNRSGGLVHARADRVGNEVAIAITDTGIGLGPRPARAPVGAVQPARRRAHHGRGHRHRPGAQPAHGADDGRPHRRAVAGRPRQLLHRPPARRRGAAHRRSPHRRGTGRRAPRLPAHGAVRGRQPDQRGARAAGVPPAPAAAPAGGRERRAGAAARPRVAARPAAAGHPPRRHERPGRARPARARGHRPARGRVVGRRAALAHARGARRGLRRLSGQAAGRRRARSMRRPPSRDLTRPRLHGLRFLVGLG